MDETEKRMFYTYLAQSMFNQMKILQNTTENQSEIETYLSNSHAIGGFFSQLSQDSGKKVEKNTKNNDESGG